MELIRYRSIAIAIEDSSRVGEIRRLAASLSVQSGLDESRANDLAIAVTELATNILKHAEKGAIVLSSSEAGIEILALDRGPGMGNVSACIEDGFSTTGTAGTGLGAVSRLASYLDIYSMPGLGTAVLAIFDSNTGKSPLPVSLSGLSCGGLSVPIAGETECGDAWDLKQGPDDSLLCAIVDGLGHGPQAATAAREALKYFGNAVSDDPKPILESIHQPLRATRGAAMAVLKIPKSDGAVTYAGVGNTVASITDGPSMRRLVSYDGTLGLQVRKIQNFAYPFPKGSLAVLHTDGIATSWELGKYPGLMRRHPSLIAGVLYRDFTRGRDDATVVVLSKAFGGRA